VSYYNENIARNIKRSALMNFPIIFISYARADGLDFAHLLYDQILGFGLLPWFDKHDLQGGNTWQADIDMAIENCIAFVLVVTPQACKSEWVAKEYRLAMGLKKTIIPLVIDSQIEIGRDISPDILDKYQVEPFLNPTNDDWARFGRQLQALRKRHDIPVDILQAQQQATSTNPSERKQAFTYLIDSTHESCELVLEQLCEHHAPSVVIEASIALAKKTNSRNMAVLPGLKQALDHNLHERDARNLLELMNNEEAAKLLVEAYRTGQDHRRKDNADSLARFTNLDVIPYLRDLWRNPVNGRYLSGLHSLMRFRDMDILPDVQDFILEQNTHIDGREQRGRVISLLRDYETSEAAQIFGEILRICSKKYSTGSFYDYLLREILHTIELKPNKAIVDMLEKIMQDEDYRVMQNIVIQLIQHIKPKLV